MQTQLRLFLDWGITFEAPYQVPDQGARKVAYASKQRLVQAIQQQRLQQTKAKEHLQTTYNVEKRVEI